jgi:hypothetical protein
MEFYISGSEKIFFENKYSPHASNIDIIAR